MDVGFLYDTASMIAHQKQYSKLEQDYKDVLLFMPDKGRVRYCGYFEDGPEDEIVAGVDMKAAEFDEMTVEDMIDVMRGRMDEVFNEVCNKRHTLK